LNDILRKHAKDNYFDLRWSDFESALDNGQVHHGAIPSYFLIRTSCMSCDADSTAIKYHGNRILIDPNGNTWERHKCRPVIGPDEGHAEPTPEEEIDVHERADIEQELLNATHPDDPNVRDGSGNLRSGGWHDEYPDDPYNYPDIPYVDPTRGNHR